MTQLLISRKNKILVASAATILVAFLAMAIGYGSGYRLTVWPPNNYWVCEGNVDRPAGFESSPLTETEQKEVDIQFEKSCPGFKSGWYWGEWTITKPTQSIGAYDTVFRGVFWRPYYGFIWPDNNFGKQGLYFTNSN